MNDTAPQSVWAEIEALVGPFENALLREGTRDLAGFLPDKAHPLYSQILAECIRIDLEYGWEHGAARPLVDYRREFPEFFRDPVGVRAVAFEEYRLRRGAGEIPLPQQYARDFGIDTRDWPAGKPAREAADAIATADLRHGLGSPAGLPNLIVSFGQPLPEVGEKFLDFELVAELGRGSFGRVYLARQQALADRPVALKIAPTAGGESQTLARLQHTHIVPVYSVHMSGPLQAVCMPFFGRLTLADILKNLRNRPSLPESGADLLTTLRPPDTLAAKPAQADAALLLLPEEQSRKDQAAETLLKKLRSWSYVEAVLWLGSCLADGLAHAHERGIQHRDLKPANVLLTDEGVPMLLDFNLAADVRLETPGIGGTLPYMAPEQIEAFRGRAGTVDARADLFSLGIILFELLTGHSPWEHCRGEGRPPEHSHPVTAHDAIVDRLYRQHQQPAASVRRYNAHASPAVAAIIRHCLEPEPARRFQTARQLQEDLQRQLEALPLKHTREPSLRERLRKRLRRSPRLAARAAAVAAACLLVAALGFGLYAHHLWQGRQAEDQYAAFRKDLPAIQFALNIRDDQNWLAQGRAQCQQNLQRYRVLSDAGWRGQAAVAALPEGQRHHLEMEIGDLLLLLVLADLRLRGPNSPPLPADEFAQLLAWNEEAERCLSVHQGSPVALFQRAELYERQGDKKHAEELRETAGLLPLATAPDCCGKARQLMSKGQLKLALPLLQKAVHFDPRYYWAQFLSGSCHEDLGNDRAAAAAYSVCIALEPEFFGAWFNRGLAHFRAKQYEAAADDLSQVITLRADDPKPYINRALAENKLGQLLQGKKDLAAAKKHFQQAHDDLTRALQLGSTESRVYFVRAGVKLALGDANGAACDRAEGLQRIPTDEASWVARGLQQKDPQAALNDFDQALKLNPSYRPAWNNKAYIYDGPMKQQFSDTLQLMDMASFIHPADPVALAVRNPLLGQMKKHSQQALACLDRVTQLYPDHALGYAGRGVLLARLGKWAAARKDAQTALGLDQSREILYQVGCIYALTSKYRPEDRGPALKLITDAVRAGYGAQFLATDPDLNPLRSLAEFKKLKAAAAALNR